LSLVCSALRLPIFLSCGIVADTSVCWCLPCLVYGVLRFVIYLV
jgi:hypothetical protein